MQQQFVNYQYFCYQYEDQCQFVVGVQLVVVYDFQYLIVGVGGENVVVGISQFVKVEFVGEQCQCQYVEKCCQWDVVLWLQEECYCVGDGVEQ